MKHLLPIILLLVAVQGFAQEPQDSAFAEKKDSMSSLSIKPVKHPKKLLGQIIERLHEDLKETHKTRRYLVEGTFRKSNFPPFYVKGIYTVEGDNGLEIIRDRADRDNITLEDFSYDEPHELSSQDTISLIRDLAELLNFSPTHASHMYYQVYYPPAPFVYYSETTRWYDIKAYEIKYGPNKGTYRIQLDKKKNRYLWREHDHEIWLDNYKVTAYFDRNTLRITQFKGETASEIAEYPFNIGSTGSTRFLIDYDNVGGKPVLKRIVFISTRDLDHTTKKKGLVQIIPE